LLFSLSFSFVLVIKHREPRAGVILCRHRDHLSRTSADSFRNTLARLGEQLCRTPEEWKAWSQNLGHESEATTFVGCGHVPTHRAAEIMRGLANPRLDVLPPGVDIAALKAFLQSVEKV
jgi:hypothetical protein